MKALPIKSAPRDGSHVILIGPSNYSNVKHNYTRGYWDGADWRNISGGWLQNFLEDPTHWHPLLEIP